MIPLDGSFELELANDVVASREDEGVWVVVLPADELIVSSAAIEGVGAVASIEDIISFAAFNEVIAVQPQDEVVLIGTDEGNTRFRGGFWGIGVIGANDDACLLRDWEAAVILSRAFTQGFSVGINDGERCLSEEVLEGDTNECCGAAF